MLRWRALRTAVLTISAAMIGMAAVHAADLKTEIAPTGKLRVGIAISPAGGAFWCTKTDNGYSGVPAALGKAMAEQLGVPVEYVEHDSSGMITDAAAQNTWDVSFLPKDPEREKRMSFGPVYEAADATYIVKAGSSAKNFATLDVAGVEIAAVKNTTTMRGAQAHLKKAKVVGFGTFEEMVWMLKAGEIEGFAETRDQLNAVAKTMPGSRVLDETFRKTMTAVAVPLNHPQSLAFVSKFMTDAKGNGALRKAYDDSGMKDTPLRMP